VHRDRRTEDHRDRTRRGAGLGDARDARLNLSERHRIADRGRLSTA
jgi:hypothetical protein